MQTTITYVSPQELQPIIDRLSAVETLVTSLQTAGGTTTSALTDLTAKIADLTTKYTDLAAKIASDEQSSATLVQQMAAITQRLGTLEQTVAALTKPPAPAPVLTSIAPASYTADNTDHSMTLTGQNFVAGNTLMFTLPSGTSTTSDPTKLTVVSPTQIDYQFNSASASGQWQVRVNSSDGTQHSAYVQFAVQAAVPAGLTLSASPTSLAPSDHFTVTWSGAVNPTPNDWISIFIAGATDNAYGEWHYTPGTPSGTLSFTAPAAAGTYEARFFYNNGGVSAAKSGPITVSAAPPAPPPPSGPDVNKIGFRSRGAAPSTNVPIRFGRAFVQGEIPHFPEMLANGAPIATQANVKNRWPDGSAKFAVLSGIMPTMPNDQYGAITFRDMAAANDAPLTTQQMLNDYNFDAIISITRPASFTAPPPADQSVVATKMQAIVNGAIAFTVDGVHYELTGLNLAQIYYLTYLFPFLNDQAVSKNLPFRIYFTLAGFLVIGGKQSIALAKPSTGTDIGPLIFPGGTASLTVTPPGPALTVSARQMLQDGAITQWATGPIAHSVLLADRTVSRRYDMGWNTVKPLQPAFYLTFYPATKQVHVRVGMENSNTEFLQSIFYDVEIKLGTAGTTVYTQNLITHALATRWDREFWLGGDLPKMDIDYGRSHLARTGLVPNYDPNVAVTLADLDYPSWQAALKRIGDPGFWDWNMPDPGARQDIGPSTTWSVWMLMSGTAEAREIALGQASLAGSWPMNLREGNPNKFADAAHTIPGIGKPCSFYDRPTAVGLDTRAEPTAADAITPQQPMASGYDWDVFTSNNWVFDMAHQPDAFFMPYFLTGELYWLEGLQHWAFYDAMSIFPGSFEGGRRGPNNGAQISGQLRGQAWVFGERCKAAAMTPDGDPIKTVLNTMVNEAICFWEGKFGIRGTPNEGTPNWTWRNSFSMNLDGKTDDWMGLGIPIIPWWMWGGYGVTDATMFNLDLCYSANSAWMHYYMLCILGTTMQMGFAVEPLYRFTAQFLIAPAMDLNFNMYLLGKYTVPDLKKGPPDAQGNPTALHFQNWDEVQLAFAPAERTSKDIGYWPWSQVYMAQARAAAAEIANTLGRHEPWDRIEAVFQEKTALTGQAVDWGLDPAWAIVPIVPPTA